MDKIILIAGLIAFLGFLFFVGKIGLEMMVKYGNQAKDDEIKGNWFGSWVNWAKVTIIFFIFGWFIFGDGWRNIFRIFD